MSVPPGPQPGAAAPAVPAADHRSPEAPSASGLAVDATQPASHPTPAAQQQPPAPQQASEGDAESYEATHVHSVYEAIAPHFSSTRYKPWPLVSSFLLSLPPGSVGLDAGCGNGKYIGVNPSLFIVASDRSANLVSLARNYQPPHFNPDGPPPKGKGKGKGKGKKTGDAASDAVVGAAAEAPATPPAPKNQVLVADSLALPYRESAFDFAISIAVIHHMSTRSRRQAAVAALLAAVRPREGRALVMVWALEQGGSRRGWDAGAEQDQLVSWVTKGTKTEEQEKPQDTTFQRYYHLYREGELEEDVVAVGGRVLESGYERDNWWAIFCRDS
ncbi:tRNA-methyltransferase trm9 [Colletotrichum plurivorum]|uniref:tRNA-methyltransferase trm9 n=1 Tax=Colletotrichum plurivorum TaxID=2175906 RepID=A0A8H6KHL7_9PEZI|nr:tRNA-methyltransferase trm9 [Colletotrichum plurivorum]